jgi:L-fuculose-phosphate aldolase
MNRLLELNCQEQIAATMTRVYDRKMTTITGGNISVLDEHGDIWITPSGIDKGNLKPKDIVCAHADGTIEGLHKPSIELPFHSAIYRARPDVKCVIHAHPKALVAFSISHELPDLNLSLQAKRIIGDVIYTAYASPGTDDLGKNLAAGFKTGANAVMLQNHGVCVVGKDLSEAFLRFEQLEIFAQTQINAARYEFIRSKDHESASKRLTGHDTILLEDKNTPDAVEKGKALLALIARAYDHNLMLAGFGVCSLRLAADKFLVTPAGCDLTAIGQDDLVVVSSKGIEAGKHVDALVNLHRAIYANDSTINVLLNAQPPAAMAFAISKAEMDLKTIPENILVLLKLVELSNDLVYEDPAGAARQISETSPVGMIANNSILVSGTAPLQAYTRLEVLDNAAESFLDSQLVGTPQLISEAEYKKLYESQVAKLKSK